MKNNFSVKGADFSSVDVEWVDAPASFNLKENEIHIWKTRLFTAEAVQHGFPETLSPDEMNWIHSIPNMQRRKETATSLLLTRRLIARYLDVPQRQLAICRIPNHKPEIMLDGEPIALFVNWSHTQDMMLFACARHKIGIDIQAIHSAAEYSLLYACMNGIVKKNKSDEGTNVPKLEPYEFTQYWTACESLFKGFGTGSLLQMIRGADTFTGLQGYCFQPENDCLGAVVGECPCRILGYRF